MKKILKKSFIEFKGAIKILAGVVITIVGILGLVFPIIPGWILIFVGLSLLGFPIVKKFKHFIKKNLKK